MSIEEKLDKLIDIVEMIIYITDGINADFSKTLLEKIKEIKYE